MPRGRDPSFGAKRFAGEWECQECSTINTADDDWCTNCRRNQDGFLPDEEDEENE